MRTSESVAALKNVDFPHDGFPTSPSNIVGFMMWKLKRLLWDIGFQIL